MQIYSNLVIFLNRKNVYPNISQLKLRRLTDFDLREFHKAVMESTDSIKTFLDMGYEFENMSWISFQHQYYQMLRDTNIEHLVVFHGYKMLAYACFCEG